ncbi:MAG: N-6 DNA methylase [Bacteroidales bacterium]
MKIEKIDTFYTPPKLAKCLLEHVDILNIENVVDFCVGKGELLKAAEEKFGDIKCFGTDIDKSIVYEIKNTHKHWNIEICDFTDSQSRSNTSILKEGYFDLILSNPPFTCRGSKINKVEYCGSIFHVSTAMMFLVKSLQYLKLSGCLYAIMPSSIIFSEKDKKLICSIRNNYNIEILKEIERQPFKNCAPNIVLIKICRKKEFINEVIEVPSAIPIYKMPIIYDAKGIDVKIFRGNLCVHEAIKFKNDYGRYFIHSTNLRNNTIVYDNLRVDKASSEIIGPAILIHRVGNPDISKVCKLPKGESVILSDCVIAIMTKSQNIVNKMFDAIIRQETVFLSLYKGTGAKYLTIDRVRRTFNLY